LWHAGVFAPSHRLWMSAVTWWYAGGDDGARIHDLLRAKRKRASSDGISASRSV
jgi:hypothetical protein